MIRNEEYPTFGEDFGDRMLQLAAHMLDPVSVELPRFSIEEAVYLDKLMNTSWEALAGRHPLATTDGLMKVWRETTRTAPVVIEIPRTEPRAVERQPYVSPHDRPIKKPTKKERKAAKRMRKAEIERLRESELFFAAKRKKEKEERGAFRYHSLSMEVLLDGLDDVDVHSVEWERFSFSGTKLG